MNEPLLIIALDYLQDNGLEGGRVRKGLIFKLCVCDMTTFAPYWELPILVRLKFSCFESPCIVHQGKDMHVVLTKLHRMGQLSCFPDQVFHISIEYIVCKLLFENFPSKN